MSLDEKKNVHNLYCEIEHRIFGKIMQEVPLLELLTLSTAEAETTIEYQSSIIINRIEAISIEITSCIEHLRKVSGVFEMKDVLDFSLYAKGYIRGDDAVQNESKIACDVHREALKTSDAINSASPTLSSFALEKDAISAPLAVSVAASGDSRPPPSIRSISPSALYAHVILPGCRVDHLC